MSSRARRATPVRQALVDASLNVAQSATGRRLLRWGAERGIPQDVLRFALRRGVSTLDNTIEGALVEASAVLGAMDQETSSVGPFIGASAQAPLQSQAISALRNAQMATQIGNALSSVLATYATLNAVQPVNSIYGTTVARPTTLPASEMAYNRAKGISDFTASNCSLSRNTGDGLNDGRALASGAGFGGNGGNANILADLRRLLSTN